MVAPPVAGFVTSCSVKQQKSPMGRDNDTGFFQPFSAYYSFRINLFSGIILTTVGKIQQIQDPKVFIANFLHIQEHTEK